MGNFNQNNSSSRGRDFGGRRSNRASMHQVVCSKCGKDCEVPFKPTGSRPVFCSQCFEDNGGPSPRRSENRGSNRGSSRSNFRDKGMFDAICDECGKNCKVPFQPSSGKPIYCSNCFEGRSPKGNRNAGQCQCKKEIESLNTKLDKILKLLSPVVPVEEVKVKKSKKILTPEVLVEEVKAVKVKKSEKVLTPDVVVEEAKVKKEKKKKKVSKKTSKAKKK
jgi:CxxC-x17-CxxC domain-containing protein